MPCGFGLRALREASDEIVRDSFSAFVVVQDLREEADLVEKAVLVQRILFLRNLVLLERFLRLAQKAEAIPEIGPDVGVIGAARNRFFVMLDRVRPVLVVVIPVGQSAGGLGGGELGNIGRRGGGGRNPGRGDRGRGSAAGREKTFDDGLGRVVRGAAQGKPCCAGAKPEGEKEKQRDGPSGWSGRRWRFRTSFCHRGGGS